MSAVASPGPPLTVAPALARIDVAMGADPTGAGLSSTNHNCNVLRNVTNPYTN